MYDIKALERAGSIHAQIREEILNILTPNLKLVSLVDFIENRVVELGAKSAFPTGCSLNNVAAHYTPNTGDNTILGSEDLVKIDFGVHINGNIIDAAFSFSFSDKYQPLIEATQEATTEVIKKIGVDTRFSEIGETVEDIISSYEFNNKKLKSIRNLCGHSINLYQVHGGQTVINVKNDSTERIKANQCYAIETFASAGRGLVEDDGVCSHYMKQTANSSLSKAAREFSSKLDMYQGLPFCRRWVDRDILPNHLKILKELCDKNVVKTFPPLVDTGPTSQFERTIYVREEGTTVL